MEQKPEAQKANAAETVASSAAIKTVRELVALATKRGGVLGVKAGMTQVYAENGDALAVTVIDLKPAVITQIKTKDNDGYQAVQVGFLEKKAKAATKPEQGHAKAVGAPGFYHYQEFRFGAGEQLSGLTVGKVLSADFVKPGDLVDVTAESKGKGFQGVIKRYHFAGGFKTHGASLVHRSLGSIGNRADPGRVFPGKKMAGNMGHEQVTVQNVRVVAVDVENQLLLVHGSVPGPRSGIVTVQKAVKTANKVR
ncbi:50S ribosomal protein L3 [Bdellovibrionota bacterium FG-1]